MNLNANFVTVKNKRAVYLLFLANIISGIAQGISMLAIPWYFSDNMDVFFIWYLVITGLTLFWGIYAGTLVDRYSRRRLFIVINTVCGILIGGVALYGSIINSLSDFFVILVFGITIFNYNIHYPNLYAFGQEITEPKYYGKLNSYIEVQGQVTSVLAGGFAAILLNGGLSLGAFKIDVNKWEIYEIFLLDAATYFVVIFLFILMNYTPIKKNNIDTEKLLGRLKGGIKYLLNHSVIFIFGLVSYMLFAFTIVEIHVLLPGYVSSFLQEGGDVFAAAEICYSLGAIFSGLLILRLLRKWSTVTGVIILMSCVAIAFYAMCMWNVLWIFFIGNLVLGITNAGIRILRTTYIFNQVPNNLIGRVGSVFGTLNIVVRMLLIGLLALPFFQINDNIRFGYMVGMLLMFASISVLIYFYKNIVESEKD